MLLTDEEIKDLVDRDYPMVSNGRWVAKAQLKKVVEWGNEDCPHPSTFDGQRLTKKRKCSECWQVLIDEVKDATE